MKRVMIYEGYCDYYYVTDKPVKGLVPVAGPMEVCDAESWVDAREGCIQLDRDLLDESGYCYDGDDYDLHSFDYEEEFGRHDFAIDKNGWVIKEGDKVLWIDPEFGYETEYVVFDEPCSGMVKLWSDHGECEALPCECEIIEKD